MEAEFREIDEKEIWSAIYQVRALGITGGKWTFGEAVLRRIIANVQDVCSCRGFHICAYQPSEVESPPRTDPMIDVYVRVSSEQHIPSPYKLPIQKYRHIMFHLLCFYVNISGVRQLIVMVCPVSFYRTANKEKCSVSILADIIVFLCVH